MGYFPFFMDVEGQEGLIVGGGKVALRKVLKLLPFHPRLTVVAPVIEKDFLEHPEVICKVRSFAESDVCGKMFVIAASDDKDLNHFVACLCKAQQIPVNVVDDKEACSFLFPALVKEGHLTVGISTEGASPAVAGYLRGQIEAMLPEGIGKQLGQMETLRKQVKKELTDQEQRAEIFRENARQCVNLQEMEAGTVALIGAGCGAYDLITLRGMRFVQGAQVIVYDDLIDERLLSFAGESCERIYVGKRSGIPSMPQEEINEMLVTKAKEGKRVVRLKGGDPFVFGRGGEELLALAEAGIKTQVVPGISSAVGVPEQAGIPVTHRNVSRSFHVITAHTSHGNATAGNLSSDGTGIHELPINKVWSNDDEFLAELKKYAALSGTLVFLMGFGKLKEIAQRLIAYGKAADTPAAVVQGRFDGETKVVRGSLLDIADKTAQAGMKAPAVIVVGECAGMEL